MDRVLIINVWPFSGRIVMNYELGHSVSAVSVSKHKYGCQL